MNEDTCSQGAYQIESTAFKAKSIKSQKSKLLKKLTKNSILDQNSQQILQTPDQAALTNLARQLEPLTNERIVVS